MRITIKSFWPAVIWFVLSSVAFCLPGQMLPGKDWFSIIQLDKWIHIGLFSIMVFLWSIPLFHRSHAQPSITRSLIWISIGFFSYGIVVELVQHYFIPHRSFDLGDIAADATGCLIGFFFVKRQGQMATK